MDTQSPNNIGHIEPISLQEEMATSYMQFAMSTIMARALPDVRDGLKPSQRRILVAMNEEGLTPDRAHAKSMAIVGETMKTYHPHGDASIYDALVRMGQDFNARYQMVDPQGNFGSVDGDPAGAARYTEARLSEYAMTMLEDLDRDTVDFQPTYDEKNMEPVVLPGAFPNLICNGSSGIAVGYATNIPPHNLGEVLNAAVALLDDPELTPEAMLRFIPGPDFPTAGIILGSKGIRNYFLTGRGSIIMQARAVIEPLERGRNAILVSQLPYQISKSALLKQIASLVDKSKLEGISDLRDESDRNGMRVVIELKRDANPQVTLNQLYKHTLMRTSFGANMLALVPGPGGVIVPRMCNIKDLITEFLRHRRIVVTRRTEFLLKQAQDRLHIVEGLLRALDIIDEIIALIRASQNRVEARDGLMREFSFSEIQAEHILNMQLARLTRLSRDELVKEQNQLLTDIAEYELILGDENHKTQVIKDELAALRKHLGDDRRTLIINEEVGDISTEDLIAREAMTVTITRDGYIKRMPMDTYRVQRRGGKGILALNTKEEDDVQDLFVANTHDLIICLTDKGHAYQLKAWQVPMASRIARGTPIVNLVPVEQDEQITAQIPVRNFAQGGYLVMVTEQGMIKKTALSQYDTALRAKGLIAISLHKGDRLNWVAWTDGNKDIIMCTREGKSARFSESQVRPMGRNAAGVTALRLRPGDAIIGMAVVNPEDERDLLVVSENGLGKRTALREYPRKGRPTQGVLTLNVTEKTGQLAGVLVVEPDDEIMCLTSSGVLIRVPVEGIRETGRNAQGVWVVRPTEGQNVVALAKIVKPRPEDIPTASAPDLEGDEDFDEALNEALGEDLGEDVEEELEEELEEDAEE
ncbi:MAG TPA: DNA gyrase subunit A [Armatimonadota bacterium]|jgi:DNA gyrase subunit A